MKQVILARAPLALSLSDSFIAFPLSSGMQSADLSRTPFPTGGTLGKMFVWLDATPASGTTKVFTLYINGSPTACVVTINDTGPSGQYTGAAVAINSGDYVYIAYTHTGTPGSSAAATISFEFTGTSASTSVYCGGAIPLTSTTPRWFECFNPSDFINTTALIQSNCVVSAPGTITAMYFSIGAAAGTTGSYKVTIYKNGTAQDGTGGTPDTRITITNVITRVDSSAAFSLPVVAGDLLVIQCDGISTPSSKTGALALRFVATNDGESNLSFALPSFPSSVGATSYNTKRYGSLSWNAVTAREIYIAAKFKLQNFYMYFTVAPGATKSRTFVSVNNGSTGANTITVADANTTGSDLTHKETYAAAGDRFAVQESAVANTPTASLGSMGFTMFIQPGGNAGKGDSGNKSGGGGVHLLQPGGALYMNIGNAGLDIVSD
jgi:hypothetical protein